jgi:hypothetical protein
VVIKYSTTHVSCTCELPVATPSSQTLQVHGLINEQTFYSDDRDLKVEWWLVVQASARQKGKKNAFNHIFGASTLFKRGAIGQLLQAMPRRDFKDWTKPSGFEGTGSTHNNVRTEMRQWFSGSAMYSALIQALTARVPKQPLGLLIQVRDYTAYDDELLKAVAGVNSSGPVVIAMAYHGCCWFQPAAGNAKLVNQDNLQAAARDAVRSRIAAGTYARIKLEMGKFGPEPSRQSVVSGSRVASKPEDYDLCYPKDNELLIKQSVMAVGATLGTVAILDPLQPDRSWTWESLVLAHNTEFNPTGLAWSPNHPNKRAGEEGSSNSAAAGVGSQAFLKELTTKQATPIPLDAMSKVVPANQNFQLYIHSDGRLFLSALQDADVPADFKLFKVMGTFLVGAPAKSFMAKSDAQYVPYDLKPESRVFLSAKPAEPGSSGPELQLPTSILTLQAAYDMLAAKKQGRVELHKHTVSYLPGSSEQMMVKSDEDCCLQVVSSGPAGGGAAQVKEEVAADKVSGMVSFQNLQAVEAVHQLQYDPQLKRLKPMLPVMVPQSGFLIIGGAQYQL